MALIQVTPDLLNGKATELRGIKDEHDQAMARMRSLILGLNDIWKGDAQSAFVAKYESMQGTFTAFSQMIDDYATLMNTTAAKMQESDSTLAGSISGFGS
ncbi:MAG: WXG100 family type VII secretion target [Clostridiales bacterium]|nr:WXG100 family type VII secretion target [Clostridiales bacterium]MBR5425557.1 WXG100 family type VII secretion target [Clostridiales bacterium]MCR5274858.1 WXG100 family type VII secretion target [Clostridiales bacterium]